MIYGVMGYCLALVTCVSHFQAIALHDYVDKEEKGAIQDCVTRALTREQGDALRKGGGAIQREGDVASLLADRRTSEQVGPDSIVVPPGADSHCRRLL